MVVACTAPSDSAQERLLGALLALASLASLVLLAARGGLDALFLLGLLAGLVIGLGWRPVHRAVRPVLDRWVAGRRSSAARVVAGAVAFPVPLLLTPLAAGLLVLVHARFGLAAFLVSLGDTFMRMALGREAGPGGTAR
jgi:hypothetical protein